MNRYSQSCIFFIAMVFLLLFSGFGWLHAGVPPANTEGKADIAADNQFTAIRQKAMEAYEKEAYKESLPLLTEAYALNSGDAEVAGRLGFAAKENGAYEQAIGALEKAVALQPDQYYYWWWLSDAQRLLGDYDAALKSMERARDLAPAETRNEMQEYVTYTEILADKGRSWENFNQHVSFAERHKNMRRVRRQIEEYVNALEAAPETAEINAEDAARLGWVYQQIGIQYNYVEEPDVAVDYFLQSLEYARLAKSPADIMRNEQFLAIAWRLEADRDKSNQPAALEKSAFHWRKALDAALSGKDVVYQRYTQARLLETLLRLRSPEDAEMVALREVNGKETPWQGPINEFSVAEAVLAEGRCRLVEGDYAGARILFEMALPYFEASNYLTDYQQTAALCLELAHVYYTQEHYEQSLSLTGKALEKADQARSFVDADAFNRSAGERTARGIAAVRARNYIAQGQYPDAFREVEKYKSGHLLNLLGSKIVDDAVRTDAASEENVLRRRIPMLQERLRRAESEQDAAETERLRLRLQKDEERLAWLERDILFKTPLQLGYKPLEISSVEALQKALPQDSTFLSYLCDEYGSVAVTASKEAVAGMVLEAKESDLLDTIGLLHAAGGEDADVLASLHAELVSPIIEKVMGEVLVISPDVVLTNIPWAALGGGEACLGGRFALVYADTASQLLVAFNAEPQKPAQYRMVLGRPGAEASLCESGKIVQEPTCLKEQDLTVAKIVSDVQRNEVLHLACRIEASPVDAMLCSIQWVGGETDNELSAAALLDMKLPAALAVLDWRGTSEASGLPDKVVKVFTEAFRNAGTRALVIIDPNIPEEARSVFFEAFYPKLASMDKGRAMKTAVLAVRDAFPDTGDWAGFALKGDYR